MSISLVIRPASSDIASADAVQQWQWLELDRKGQPVGPSRSGSQPPPSDSALLLIPTNWLHAQCLQLPVMRRAQLHKAVPFALEEHVAGDVEQLHVAHGMQSADGAVIAVAIEPYVLERLVRQLQDLNIKAVKAIPDACACANAADDGLTIMAVEQDYLVSSGQDFLLLGEDELEFLLGQQTAETGITWHGQNRPGFDWQGPLQASLNDDPFGHLAQTAGKVSINMLQQDFAPASSNASRQSWRLAAALAGAVVVTGLAYAVTDWWLLSNAVDDYRSQVQTTFRDIFPQITNVSNPRVQAERELAELNPAQGDALLSLLGSTAPVLAAQQGLVLDTVNYDRTGLRLEVVASSVAELDELASALQRQGLPARLDGAVRSADSVRGQIVIAGAGNG